MNIIMANEAIMELKVLMRTPIVKLIVDRLRGIRVDECAIVAGHINTELLHFNHGRTVNESTLFISASNICSRVYSKMIVCTTPLMGKQSCSSNGFDETFFKLRIQPINDTTDTVARAIIKQAFHERNNPTRDFINKEMKYMLV